MWHVQKLFIGKFLRHVLHILRVFLRLGDSTMDIMNYSRHADMSALMLRFALHGCGRGIKVAFQSTVRKGRDRKKRSGDLVKRFYE